MSLTIPTPTPLLVLFTKEFCVKSLVGKEGRAGSKLSWAENTNEGGRNPCFVGEEHQQRLKKSEIRDIVDMPDKDLDLMIRLLHQNQGMLASRKRKLFDKLTETEISRMEKVFREIFIRKPGDAANLESF